VSRWNNTQFSRALNLRYPIVQGPFGGGNSTAALAAAVSNAGGLGSFGAVDQQPEKILDTVKNIRALTDKPFAINNWVPLTTEPSLEQQLHTFNSIAAVIKPYFDQLQLELPSVNEFAWPNYEHQVEAILEAAPPVWSFVFGVPQQEYLDAARKRGIRTLGTATTVEEARALEAAGVDFIVASGSDAGGHRGSFLRPAEESFVGTFSLIPQIADAVAIPVIAAGGIGNGRAIKAALTLGADAVQIGTRFLACHESNASLPHKRLLHTDIAYSTSLTKAFSGRYARGISNRLIREMRAKENDIGHFPVQYWLTGIFRREAAKQGNDELLSLWAGQAMQYAKDQSAAECMVELIQEFEALES